MTANASLTEEIRRFEAQHRRNPESLVFARLADAYRKAGEPERALEVLAEGLSRHADYASAHIVRARAMRDLNRLAEARAALERVLELDPRNLVALHGLASLASERGDVEEARRWFSRLVQEDPLDSEAAEMLSRLESVSGVGPGAEAAVREGERGDEPAPKPPAESEPETAAEWGAETARSEWGSDSGEEPAPSEADLLTKTMADLYAEQGLHAEALEIYEELLKDHPGDAELIAAIEAASAATGAGRESEEGRLGPGLEGTANAGRESGLLAVNELRSLLRSGEARSEASPPPGSSESGTVEGEGRRTGRKPERREESVVRPRGGTFLNDWLRRLRE